MKIRVVSLLVCGLAMSGCAHMPPDDPSDPLEKIKRSTELAQQAGTATISTDRGNVVIDLREAEAPCTVNSFASLATPIADFSRSLFLVRFGCTIIDLTAGVSRKSSTAQPASRILARPEEITKLTSDPSDR